MPGQRREIERQLAELPESFNAGEIQKMYDKLVQDVNFMKQKGIPLATMESELHKRHKTLAFSYPTLFFRIVRGEMDEHIFRTLMGLKKKVDDGELTNERAKEMVIDSAKQQVDGEVPRMQRVKKEGGTVQEINLKCRVEDGLTQVSDNKS